MSIHTAEQIRNSQAWAPHAQFWSVEHHQIRHLTETLNSLNASMWTNGTVDTRAAGAIATAAAELLASIK